MSRILLVGLLLIGFFTHTVLGAPPTQGNLLFLGIALNQRGTRGAWAQIGEPEAWKNARAGAIFQDRLFTAEKDGFLWVSDLDTGERARVGKPDFAATTFMFAGQDSLYTIESNGEVSRDCICLPTEGIPLLVKQNGTWYPARLLSRIEEKYEIHYLGFNEDEVVTADRIRYPFAGKGR